MGTNIFDGVLLTLLIAALGLLAASGVYGLLRAVEQWNREVTVSLNLFMCGLACVVAATYSDGRYLDPFIRYVLAPSIVCAVGGFKFHQNSGGGSPSIWDAIVLIVAATIGAMAIDILLLVCNSSWPGHLSQTPIYFHLFLMLAPVPLVPLLVYLFQNSRLRPGIDRHLEAGEEV